MSQETDNAPYHLLNEATATAHDLGMKSLLGRLLARRLQLQAPASGLITTSIDAVTAAVHEQPPDLRTYAAPDGTVTVMFTDIEDSTSLTERLGDTRWQDVLREHNDLVRQQLRAHGGYEVKTLGDGFMVAFGSARRALECAIAIQRAVAEYGQQHADTPIRVRIGLHTGEVVREADDFFGKHVILASRIATQAQGGEILVSSLLKELTESAGEFRFGEEQQVTLKGLAGTQRVYGVVWS